MNSAALGAALRSRHVHRGGEKAWTYSQSIEKLRNTTQVKEIQPHKDAKSVSYGKFLYALRFFMDTDCVNKMHSKFFLTLH